MHGEIVDEEAGIVEGVQVWEAGRGQEHDDVPLGHEHHLSLHVQGVVLVLGHQVSVVLVLVFRAAALEYDIGRF